MMLRSILLGLAVALGSPGASAQHVEERLYPLRPYQPPDGEVIEVGGLAFVSHDDLLVSTRRGRVWWVADALADDPADARWHVFADGLHEGLGLSIVDGAIYVIQRGELSRLIDHDGDRRCDEIETIASGWGMSGNYHEFAFGLPRDAAGNFYISTNLGFFSPEWWHGAARAPLRGFILQIAPDGEVRPFAHGVRSPCGFGMNSAGDLFYTDNQGDWMATCPIFHVKQGAFFGHPASLRWTAAYGDGERVPSTTQPPDVERAPAAIWLPYEWSRSAGNLIEDRSAGAFGPFAGQMFVAELTNGRVLRTQFERVRGEYQGAVFPFRERLGSVCRVAFAPDHSMVLGYTNRGWGGRGPGYGLARMGWSGEVPFEIERVALRQDGFEVTFTKPLARAALGTVEAELYDYNYWWEYGSPVQHRTPVSVSAVELGVDGRRAFVRLDGLEPARCIRLQFDGFVSAAGEPLLHDTFHYTINQLPAGPLTALRVNRVVAPPKARQGDSDGWLHLTWGDATGLWNAEGWELCDVELGADSTRLETRPGVGALVQTGSRATPFESRVEFSDCEFWFRCMLPKGGRGGVCFMNRYELALDDADDVFGGVRGGPTPAAAGYAGFGSWHLVRGEFFAPRFDRHGVKVAPARFGVVTVEGVEVLRDVELDAPNVAASPAEVARAPLSFRAGLKQLCLGDVRVRPLGVADPAGATDDPELFTGADLAGWSREGGAQWNWSDGELRASGGPGRLVTIADDWREFDLRLRASVGGNGSAALQILCDGARRQTIDLHCNPNARTKLGSLVGVYDIHTDLVPAATPFDLTVRCTVEPRGTRIRITLNGAALVDELLDPPATRGARLALELGEGGELVMESLRGIRH